MQSTNIGSSWTLSSRPRRWKMFWSQCAAISGGRAWLSRCLRLLLPSSSSRTSISFTASGRCLRSYKYGSVSCARVFRMFSVSSHISSYTSLCILAEFWREGCDCDLSESCRAIGFSNREHRKVKQRSQGISNRERRTTQILIRSRKSLTSAFLADFPAIVEWDNEF